MIVSFGMFVVWVIVILHSSHCERDHVVKRQLTWCHLWHSTLILCHFLLRSFFFTVLNFLLRWLRLAVYVMSMCCYETALSLITSVCLCYIFSLLQTCTSGWHYREILAAVTKAVEPKVMALHHTSNCFLSPPIDFIWTMMIVWRIRGKLSKLFCAVL